MASVYIHLFPNGKRYIGITSQKLSKRWGRGSGYHKDTQTRIRNAIEKYGWDNIQHIIYADEITFEEAKKIEIELIKKYKTIDKKYGYNGTEGGDGTTGRIVTQEQRKKASIKQKEVFKKFGSFVSFPVHRYNLNGNYIDSFESARDAERKTGIDFRSISSCVSGKGKSTHGFMWSKTKQDKIDSYNVKTDGIPHEVYQYDKYFNFVKKYDSSRQAAKAVGISYKSLSNAIRRKHKSGGYYWFYKNELETLHLMSQKGLVDKIKEGEKEDIFSMTTYDPNH